MISLRPKRSSLHIGGELLALILVFLVSLYFLGDNKYSEVEWGILFSFLFLWQIIKYLRRIHLSHFNNGINLQVSNYFKSYFILIVVVALLYSLFPITVPNRNIVIALVMAFPVISISVNYTLIKVIDTLSGKRENIKYTLVAGTGKMAERVERNVMAKRGANFQVKGFVSCIKNEDCLVERDRVVSDLKDIHQYLKTNHVDEIVIALPVQTSKKIQNLISIADYHGIRVKYIPDYQELFGKNYKVTRYGAIDAISVRQFPLDKPFWYFLKNCFDKLFAATALTLLSPLFLVLALLVKLDSPGPVFYTPLRIGRGGRSFKLYKFRSMRQNDEVSGGMLSTQENDPRITRIGKILRKYSLDELPQFINVLLGDMSVVGPRPHRKFLNQQLQESVDYYMLRHYVKPGITGWAQVNGWRGPTTTDEQKTKRTQHDLWYVEHWSLLLDLKIVFLTVFGKKVHKNAF